MNLRELPPSQPVRLSLVTPTPLTEGVTFTLKITTINCFYSVRDGSRNIKYFNDYSGEKTGTILSAELPTAVGSNTFTSWTSSTGPIVGSDIIKCFANTYFRNKTISQGWFTSPSIMLVWHCIQAVCTTVITTLYDCCFCYPGCSPLNFLAAVGPRDPKFLSDFP